MSFIGIVVCPVALIASDEPIQAAERTILGGYEIMHTIHNGTLENRSRQRGTEFELRCSAESVYTARSLLPAIFQRPLAIALIIAKRIGPGCSEAYSSSANQRFRGHLLTTYYRPLWSSRADTVAGLWKGAYNLLDSPIGPRLFLQVTYYRQIGGVHCAIPD
jgi:hypothetical protein